MEAQCKSEYIFELTKAVTQTVSTGLMSAADLKQALKDAKAAIDASQWAEVITITARALGLPDQNGSNQFDPDADLAELLTSGKPAPKELSAIWYQTLVFRGMGLSNDAKNRDKASESETPAERAKNNKIRDSSTF